MPVIVLVADGLRSGALENALAAGSLPALAAMQKEGGLYQLTSVFPSVTGPAYTPFLMGRFPGQVGLPGLRWYDRSRTRVRLPGHSRSYVGFELSYVDGDLDANAPTIFELAPSSIAAMNVIGRGLPKGGALARGKRFALRAALTHFRGNVRGWLSIDRDVARIFVHEIERQQPAFAFAALTGIDKTSHSRGQDHSIVRQALEIVDDTVATLRKNAERAGRWNDTHLWVVSDHGHTDIREHEDLASLVHSWGYSVIAHPWVFRRRPHVAVMVSGNAMAHIYMELGSKTRPGWTALRATWYHFVDRLLRRPSVDLLLLPDGNSCVICSPRRGHASLDWTNDSYSYTPMSGDPLGIGERRGISADAAYDVTLRTEYPDSLVQIAALSSAPRSGDVILSASRDWDFRSRYEPIPHVSSHGALHRDHMLVPLLTNRPAVRAPRRTTDIMPSALKALGIAIPPGLDGESFL